LSQIIVETISITRTHITLLLLHFIIYKTQKGNKGEAVSCDDPMTRGIWPSFRFYSQNCRRQHDTQSLHLSSQTRQSRLYHCEFSVILLSWPNIKLWSHWDAFSLCAAHVLLLNGLAWRWISASSDLKVYLATELIILHCFVN